MEEELWDDSVLINAFNSAIAKYKDMHGVSSKRTSEATEKSVSEMTSGIPTYVALESKSDVLETVAQFTSEKGELHNVESPCGASKEKSQMNPIAAAENSSMSHEQSTNHSFDWVEYERQLITYQLSQISDQREKLEQRLNQLSSNSIEQATTATTCNSYAGVESYSQHSYPYAADNCYECQWRGYYNSTGGQIPTVDYWSNGLQCQHCGFINKQEENVHKASDPLPHPVVQKSSDPSPQLFAGASALPEMVTKAVSEALKAADMEQSAKHTSFSDVAGAWFLAGFQTSRYLSQESECKPRQKHP